MAEDAAAASPSGKAARFEGRRGALGALMLRNLLFSILTLGIYRFWGRTHVRRFVWRHTVLLDDALEYLGTGGELFIGFLIAVAVLLPVFAAYSLLQFLFADGPDHALLALEILYYLVLFFLVQIAIHRMRRYRLTRTAWRGVRFGLAGSSLAYARIAFGYGLLTAATLGLAYPWLRVATLRYFAQHAYFGTAGLGLAPNPVWLFRRWAAVIGSFAGALGLFAILNFGSLETIASFIDQELYDTADIVFGFMIYWPLFLLSASFFLWIWYRVVEFRHMAGCLTVGVTSFSSAVRSQFVIGRFFVFALVMFALSALLGSIAFFIAYGAARAGEVEAAVVVVAVFIPVLLVLLFSGIIRILFLDIPLLRHACETLEISNTGALDEVVQASAAVPSYGEGTAEALDVGGF